MIRVLETAGFWRNEGEILIGVGSGENMRELETVGMGKSFKDFSARRPGH